MESYTGMISHEFVTPLGTAIMFIELILSMITDEALIRLVLLVKTALNLLLSLVNNLLDLKLIRENKFKSKMNTFNPSKVIDFVKSIL